MKFIRVEDTVYDLAHVCAFHFKGDRLVLSLINGGKIKIKDEDSIQKLKKYLSEDDSLLFNAKE